MNRRLFNLKEVLEKMPPQANRMVLFSDEYTLSSVWSLGPGEEIFPHQHPSSDDVWVILEGEGEYWMEKGAPPCRLKKGMVAVAPARHAHGVRNTGSEPLLFVSITAPQPLDIEPVEGMAEETGKRD
jgi:mannose-6-phosphate isomerase-like protein (cupin superfamily)